MRVGKVTDIYDFQRKAEACEEEPEPTGSLEPPQKKGYKRRCQDPSRHHAVKVKAFPKDFYPYPAF